jgi:hypothetical protein
MVVGRLMRMVRRFMLKAAYGRPFGEYKKIDWMVSTWEMSSRHFPRVLARNRKQKP